MPHEGQGTASRRGGEEVKDNVRVAGVERSALRPCVEILVNSVFCEVYLLLTFFLTV